MQTIKTKPDSLKAISYKLKACSGFTLVELLVAIGIFSVVVSIAVGGFVSALRTERQVVALIAANSNASLAIEQLAREIRTGINFSIIDNELRFTNAKGAAIRYFLDTDANSLMREENNVSEPITGSNVRVHFLEFRLSGNLPTDGFPPRVTIMLGVSPVAIGVSSSVTNVQTTVSARQIDG